MGDRTLDQLKHYEAALEAAVKAGELGIVKELSGAMQAIMTSRNPGLVEDPAFKSSAERMPGDIKSIVLSDDPSQQAYAGAGAGALRLYQGTKEALGGGVNPQDIENNKSLQNATPYTQGGGMVGTALPFMVAPGRVGAQMLAPALRAAGGSVPSALQWGRLGTVADATLTGGGLSALTEPGGWEDRSRAAALGSVGAMIPTAAVAGVQGGRRKFMNKGGNIAIAEQIREDVGEGADALSKVLASRAYPAREFGVQPSAATLSRDPTLSTWELGSRTREGGQWTPFDRANAQARWSELERRGDPGLGAALRADRASRTDALRDEAIEAGTITSAMANSRGVPPGPLAPIRQKINELRTGDAKPNGNVQHMVDWLEKNLDEVTPGQLYEIRKLMTEDIPKGMNDKLGAALKGARVQRVELVKLIDDALDTVSGGSYGEYMAKYRELSPDVASNSAMFNIRERLRGGRGAGEVPESMGVSPAPTTLGRIAEKESQRVLGSKTFDQLTPNDRAFIDILRQDLTAQAQNMKAQGMIGSATAGNAAAAGKGASALGRAARGAAANVIVPGVGGSLGAGALEAALAKVSRMSEEQLARLLQNPQALAEALKAASAGAAIIRGAGQTGGAGVAQTFNDGSARSFLDMLRK